MCLWSADDDDDGQPVHRISVIDGKMCVCVSVSVNVFINEDLCKSYMKQPF